jgi:basic membrane protein A
MQAIGVDADQSYLGPQIITSALKKVDVAVFDAIKSVQDNTYKGGADVIASLKTNGVGIGKISAAGQKYADQVKQIQQQILDGSITPPDTVGSGT